MYLRERPAACVKNSQVAKTNKCVFVFRRVQMRGEDLGRTTRPCALEGAGRRGRGRPGRSARPPPAGGGQGEAQNRALARKWAWRLDPCGALAAVLPLPGPSSLQALTAETLT